MYGHGQVGDEDAVSRVLERRHEDLAAGIVAVVAGPERVCVGEPGAARRPGTIRSVPAGLRRRIESAPRTWSSSASATPARSGGGRESSAARSAASTNPRKRPRPPRPSAGLIQLGPERTPRRLSAPAGVRRGHPRAGRLRASPRVGRRAGAPRPRGASSGSAPASAQRRRGAASLPLRGARRPRTRTRSPGRSAEAWRRFRCPAGIREVLLHGRPG